jgi:uncharacterized protein YdiU (UPF0061 family)
MKTNDIKDQIYKDESFKKWQKLWYKRLDLNKVSEEKYLKLMRSTNPLIIPRNHNVEEALKAASKNDFQLFNELLEVLKTPYKFKHNISKFLEPAPVSNEKYQTFCGT